MRPLFRLLLIGCLFQPLTSFAKAGTTYTPTSSKSSNIGTKVNSAPATTQYSSTAMKPTTTIAPSTAAPVAKPQPSVATATPTQPTSQPSATTHTSSTVNNTTVIRESSGGGFASSMMGAAAGVVVADALIGNHNQPSTVVVQQPVMQQPAVQQQYATQTNPQAYSAQVPAIVQPKHESSSSFWSTFLVLLGLGTIIAVFYFFYKRKKTSLANMQHTIPQFIMMLDKIQHLSTLSSPLDKEKLITLCTNEMFLALTKVASENLERGLRNFVDNIVIIDSTIMSSESDDTGHYCSVKFNFKMIDYVLDQNDNLTHGSKDTPVNYIEVWTFKTSDYRTWKLSAIEDYIK